VLVKPTVFYVRDIIKRVYVDKGIHTNVFQLAKRQFASAKQVDPNRSEGLTF